MKNWDVAGGGLARSTVYSTARRARFDHYYSVRKCSEHNLIRIDDSRSTRTDYRLCSMEQGIERDSLPRVVFII